MIRFRNYKAYCNICEKYIGTPIVKKFHRGVCPLCRLKVPKYIPYNQHERWLQCTNVKSV